MSAKNEKSRKYHNVDPEEYYQYEEQFIEKGGGGSGGKDTNRQGSKTIRSLKIQQRRVARDQRHQEVEDALLMVLDQFPEIENEKNREDFLQRYVSWVNLNINSLSSLDPSELEVTFSKSGGPGGQNVNKRETKVSIRHKPTWIRVVYDQTRSQMDNRRLAEEGLLVRLENHLRDWKNYLGGKWKMDILLVKDLLKKE